MKCPLSIFLPFINAAPIGYNTLYTAMKVSVKNGTSARMRTCIIMFVQPLYMKARNTASAMCLSDEVLIVVRLGIFHALFSFMSSIGYIMDESGIKEALTTVYAENTMQHIMSGHPYARAVRVHILLQLALSKLIFDGLMKNNGEFLALAEDEKSSNTFHMLNLT